MTTFIFDELTGIPTILATNRAKRADQTGAAGSGISTSQTPVNVDRFAKGNEDLTPSTVYQDAEDWNVRVFRNKYPLVEDHEIIVHSPYQDKDLEDLPQEQNVRIMRAFLNRVTYHNSCYWCDKIKVELALKKRIVHETPHFVLLIPVACRWSYEMLLIPKEHKPNFGYVNDMEINDFTQILKAALWSYNAMFNKPDRNFWIH